MRTVAVLKYPFAISISDFRGPPKGCAGNVTSLNPSSLNGKFRCSVELSVNAFREVPLFQSVEDIVRWEVNSASNEVHIHCQTRMINLSRDDRRESADIRKCAQVFQEQYLDPLHAT
jgi:hypothetical protein